MPPILSVLLYCLIIFCGAVIGSFLNVCIDRILRHENIAMTRSFRRTSISIRYPMIGAVNALLYVFVFAVHGWGWRSVIYGLMSSALLVLSIIDIRTYEIPLEINRFLMLLGAAACLLDRGNRADHVIGFFSVSSVLYLLYLVSGGRAIGGGDVKLMAACGLLLGWRCSILTLILGCMLGSVIHIARMVISHADHVLAMGPYLSAAMFFSALWGEQMIHAYVRIFF
ncbi:MAG: A24 family peptidase [Hungatella sp.]